MRSGMPMVCSMDRISAPPTTAAAGQADVDQAHDGSPGVLAACPFFEFVQAAGRIGRTNHRAHRATPAMASGRTPDFFKRAPERRIWHQPRAHARAQGKDRSWVSSVAFTPGHHCKIWRRFWDESWRKASRSSARHAAGAKGDLAGRVLGEDGLKALEFGNLGLRRLVAQGVWTRRHGGNPVRPIWPSLGIKARSGGSPAIRATRDAILDDIEASTMTPVMPMRDSRARGPRSTTRSAASAPGTVGHVGAVLDDGGTSEQIVVQIDCDHEPLLMRAAGGHPAPELTSGAIDEPRDRCRRQASKTPGSA